jgi:hypothetical protein
MLMQIRSLIFFIIVTIICGCSKVKKLTQEDLEWMPYLGNETLVFSSQNNTDTIFLIKKDTMWAYPEAQKINGIKYEVVSIFCRHTNSSHPDGHRIEGNFLELGKSKDNNAELVISLVAKDAVFYRQAGIKLDTLKQQMPIVLQTKFNKYDDVYIITDEGVSRYYERSNYITKVYWSRSQGLVRYDKKDRVIWELANKY